MVQRLDAEGLLKYEKYRGLILTAAGKKLARRIAQRHKLLTEFLRLLGVDDRVIHHDVEGMEHHISPSTLRAIAAVTRQLQRRPAYAPNCKPVRFSTVRNSSPLRVPRARRRNGGVARLLEMQLLHAAVIGFGNGNQITIDLNLFAGLR
jgi:Mn-dependent transcriptional regulator